MDKQQIKLLKEIRKAGLYNYSHLSANERDTLFHLKSLKYVTPKANPNGDQRPLYKITELGKSALHEESKDNLKIIVPNILSISAILISLIHLILSIIGII